MSDAERIRNDGIAVERSDVSARLVAALAAGVAAFLVLSAIAVQLIYPAALHGPSDAPRLVTAKPRLQIDPVRELQAFRATEQHRLDSYGWIDKKHGIVRIPVEQAMREVAAAGIKDWPEGAR